MTDTTRTLSPLDRLLAQAGDGLKTLAGVAGEGRASPAATEAELNEGERRQSSALMRINHAGEVAAQGLYHGQALVARNATLRGQLLEAAREEQDHLRWCDQRLRALGSRPSLLTPFWYGASAAIGVLAGLKGDAASLGFVAETERQVSAHLGDHLTRLPATDAASRAVVQAMKTDEERHGQAALDAGGTLPPEPVRGVMRLVAGVMKFGAARI